MSWKGFVKAATRLPQQVARRTGHATETTDPEYDQISAKFKNVEEHAKRLANDATKFKDSLSAMLAHQQRFSETLVEVYRPFIGLSSKYDDESQHRASRAKVESFAHAMHEARVQLLPELEIIERQVVAPIKDWLVLIGNVHRLMDKRARKLVDYDRHADSVKKLQARTDRNITDEKKLGSLEANLNESTRDFTSLNLTLKQQIPTFTGLAVAFINPCFATLYRCELRIFDVLHRCFGQYASETGFNLSIPATAEFDAKHDEMMGMLESLSLAKRTYRKDSSANMEELAPPRADGKAAYMPDALSAKAVGGGSSSAAASASAITPNPPPRDAPGASPSYAVALYDFESAEPGDLSFKRDDKIEILERTEDVNDWWQGRIGARTGQFPANYVAHI
ncbi:hypothetical protein BDZ88DRAFT_394930 [Geranomyces variabilis]|nr:hypothetical protein BDZ88DRAFT_394930 [Geranomyces variabilis]